MSNDLPLIQILLTPHLKKDLAQLAKRYRSIRKDLEPLIEQLQAGEIIDDRVVKSVIAWEETTMVTQLTQRNYTPTEYLEFEAEAETRHELINGEIIPMAGGTTNHNLITGNIYVALRLALNTQTTPVYMENVRLWIPSPKVFTYPDIMILGSEPIYYEESQTTVTNPVVIFEILSNSTRDYDQGRKFNFYRTLETLQEYILVDQETTAVMIYRRDTSKDWHLTILEDTTERVQLSSVGVELSLTGIYEGVDL